MTEKQKRAQRDFMIDFASRLYHRNREALHVVLDEADTFIPQRGGDEDLVGAINDIVRKGRARGLRRSQQGLQARGGRRQHQTPLPQRRERGGVPEKAPTARDRSGRVLRMEEGSLPNEGRGARAWTRGGADVIWWLRVGFSPLRALITILAILVWRPA